MSVIKTIEGYFCDLNKFPSSCPFCHNKIIPEVYTSHMNIARLFYLDNYNPYETLEVVFRCINEEECGQFFIGYYYISDDTSNLHASLFAVSRGCPEKKKFDVNINKISIKYSQIYNEAYHAEQQKLIQICGAGYRKALEFLIKDYAIYKNPNDANKIKKMPSLGNCINTYINDNRIKKVAERAGWLGNDEVHYYRVWKDKDLEDLKRLIDLTEHWINIDIQTNDIEKDMPKKKK
jgi:hypothetical protein